MPRPVWLARMRTGRRVTPRLFGFNGELRPVPLVPAALERIDVGKTLVDQLLCPWALVNSSGQAQYKTRMVSLGYLAAKLSTASGSTRMAPLISPHWPSSPSQAACLQ